MTTTRGPAVVTEWFCVLCGAPARDGHQPTLDSRFRLGYCRRGHRRPLTSDVVAAKAAELAYLAKALEDDSDESGD